MRNEKNVLQRVLDALVAGRTRQAQRYVDSFEAIHRTGRNDKS